MMQNVLDILLHILTTISIDLRWREQPIKL